MRLEARIPASLQYQDAEPEARVSIVKEPCILVVIALIIRSITAHVIRRVNPHYGEFLGDSFTPKAPYKGQLAIKGGNF